MAELAPGVVHGLNDAPCWPQAAHGLWGPATFWLQVFCGALAASLVFAVFYILRQRRQAKAPVSPNAEAELQRQRDELARSNADLEQFAYVASHDLKAPLRAISNLARWLADDLGAHMRPQDRENLDLMLDRVARMNRMLDDLLSYSRAGRAKDLGEAVSLPVLLREVWDSLGSPQAFELDSVGLPDARVDSIPFRLLLLNLLGNAIKHHDRPSGHIKVRASVWQGRLALKVEDDGPGIPVRDRERVFQMFQTLKPRDEVEGSGIGLALVKKLVERRGGRAWLEDATTRGCRACVDWPLNEGRSAP
jgi:signal transduction histidine kinase